MVYVAVNVVHVALFFLVGLIEEGEPDMAGVMEKRISGSK